MDIPAETMALQLAQDWEALMGAFWAGVAWTAGLGALIVALGSLAALSARALRPHRFWCPAIGREVEVLFEEWGPPGVRQVLRVLQCSAFEPASPIACRRACRDATCRRPGAPCGLSGMRAGTG
jgi:hypothetical protein